MLNAGAEVDATDKSIKADEPMLKVLVRKGKINKIDFYNFTANNKYWNWFRAAYLALDILKFPDLHAMCHKIDFKRIMVRVLADDENERAYVIYRLELSIEKDFLDKGYPSSDHDSSSAIESSSDDSSDTEYSFTDIKVQTYKEITTSYVELGCLQGMER